MVSHLLIMSRLISAYRQTLRIYFVEIPNLDQSDRSSTKMKQHVKKVNPVALKYNLPDTKIMYYLGFALYAPT